MHKAAKLSRVSTGGQGADDRHSLPFQDAVMDEWAKREGWEIVRSYSIPGESAYKDFLADRPQFAMAVRDALAGHFDTLIVYDISRLARNQAVLHETLRDLRRAGVRLMVATGEWDATSDPMRAGLEGIVAEAHSRQASEKIRRALARRHSLGLPTGDIPFGYRDRDAATQRQRPCPAAGLSWRVDRVDPEINAIVATFEPDPAWMDYVFTAARRYDAVIPSRDERQRLMETRRRIDRIFKNGGMDDSEWEREIGQIDRAIRALPPEEPSRIVPAGERLAGMAEAWQDASLKDRNELCRILFEDVRMDMKTKDLAVFPRGEFAALFTARAEYVSAAKCGSTPDRTRRVFLTSGGFRLNNLAVA